LRLTLAGMLILLLLATCSSASSHETDAPAVRQLAFVHVNVIPMTQDTVLRDQTVIIERGKIKHIGPANSVRIPLKAQQIDGRGKYLMPGLVDFHDPPQRPQ
jgi:imidazolonepropionase-like amidohydrolase